MKADHFRPNAIMVAILGISATQKPIFRQGSRFSVGSADHFFLPLRDCEGTQVLALVTLI
jgi:hypothetical protein